ncbi:hypothetical protein Tco_0742910 [Tanacetum coccineum]
MAELVQVPDSNIKFKTILNMSLENKAHYESEKEAIHLLLTRIRDELYSTVDACKIAHEMWIAIERLQQESMESYYSRSYKLMNEMIRNNLTVATMQVNVQFLQQLQPEWSRFVTIVKQQHELDKVSYHKLFDILKQYQKEVNEIRAERMAKNANPLALVAAAQPYPYPYYQAPKSHKSYAPTSKVSLPTRSHATTRNKGKEIAKPITPLSESAFEEDNTDEEIDEQELEAYYSYMAKIQEVPNADSGTDSEPLEQVQYDTDDNVSSNDVQHFEQYDSINNTCAVETSDSNVISDSPDMCDNDIQDDQNDVECDDERVALANLIANLKLDVDENKKIQKQLKKANATLTQELTE